MSSAEPRNSWLSIWHVALLAPWILIVLGTRHSIRDNSFLWHIRAGTAQAESGSVFTSDPFTFTAFGEPWRTQSWLLELFYGWAEGLFGLSFAPWMVVFFSIVTFSALALLGFKVLKHPFPVAIFLVLTAVLAAGVLNPRPVIASYSLLALLVLTDSDARTRWALPLILWVWASVHGSFVLGGLYLACQLIRRREWRAWPQLLAAGVAVSVTAHGIAVWETLYRFLKAGEALSNIREWGSPDLLSLPLFPLLVGLLLLPLAAHRGWFQIRDYWLLVPFVAVGLTANRSVFPAWIALSTVFLPSLQILPLARRRITPLERRLLLSIAGMIAIGPLLLPRSSALDARLFPIDAMKSADSTRLFHDDGVGGYIVYAEWPSRLVYIDDRAELLIDELPRFVQARAATGDEWEEVLMDYEFEQALLRVEDPLFQVLRLDGWVKVFEDENFILLRQP